MPQRNYGPEAQAAMDRVRTFAAIQGRSSFDLIMGACADRDEATQDALLRQVLRGASDLLKCEDLDTDRPMLPWTDNVAQPSRPVTVYRMAYLGPFGYKRVRVTPEAPKAPAPRKPREVLESDPRPRVGVPVHVRDAHGLASMAWLAAE